MALVLLVLIVSQQLQAEDVSGKVVAISDADTLVILVDKVEVKIRLHGIDAPEKTQAFGAKARRFVVDAALGKNVTVDVLGRDKYGRSVGIVWLPKRENLNYLIVARGFAWWYRKYAPSDKKLESLEKSARLSKRGIWSQSHPIPPWEWRRDESARRETSTDLPIATEHFGEVRGNKKSHIYHLANCPDYDKISPKNRLIFQSEDNALTAGFRKAKNCAR